MKDYKWGRKWMFINWASRKKVLCKSNYGNSPLQLQMNKVINRQNWRVEKNLILHLICQSSDLNKLQFIHIYYLRYVLKPSQLLENETGRIFKICFFSVKVTLFSLCLCARKVHLLQRLYCKIQKYVLRPLTVLTVLYVTKPHSHVPQTRTNT